MCKPDIVFDLGDESPVAVFKIQREKIQRLEAERDKYRDACLLIQNILDSREHSYAEEHGVIETTVDEVLKEFNEGPADLLLLTQRQRK
jgi:hypothetical protein